MDDLRLHPQLGPIAFLAGVWQGSGEGDYPTVDHFAYGEELRFTYVGQPFLIYEQATWHPRTDQPMHRESGYWRCLPARGESDLEVVLSQPTGLVEVLTGTVRITTIELTTTAVERTPTAKDVQAVHRQIEVAGDTLRYTVSMAAMGQPMTPHLRGLLRRV